MYTAIDAPGLAGSTLQDVVELATATPHPPKAETERLLANAAGGDTAALETLVKANLRSVVDEAIRHRGEGQHVRELVRAGIRGLVSAIRAPQELGGTQDGGFPEQARRAIRREIRRTLEYS